MRMRHLCRHRGARLGSTDPKLLLGTTIATACATSYFHALLLGAVEPERIEHLIRDSRRLFDAHHRLAARTRGNVKEYADVVGIRDGALGN